MVIIEIMMWLIFKQYFYVFYVDKSEVHFYTVHLKGVLHWSKQASTAKSNSLQAWNVASSEIPFASITTE